MDLFSEAACVSLMEWKEILKNKFSIETLDYKRCNDDQLTEITLSVEIKNIIIEENMA